MDTFGLWDANQSMRIQSLPILDNLSGQILQTLGKGPYQDTINIVTQPESGQGQAYSTMKSLFDQTKKLYTQEAFLSADDLKLEDADQRATIRKVNLATFVSSVFGSQEVGFFHLNENFLDTFVPDGGRLLKSQGSLYLDLKTQAFISAMATNERTKIEILEDLFPPNMTEILLARRPGAKQLTPSEQDFVARLQHRRNHLMQTTEDQSLAEKYVWQDFLKEVNWYVSKNHEIIVAQPVCTKSPIHIFIDRIAKSPQPRGGAKVRKLRATGLEHHPEMLGSHGVPMPNHHAPAPQHNGDGIQSHENHNSHTGQSGDAEIPIDTELFGPNTSYMGAPPIAQPPVPQQSQPTQVLYERARLAATSKASPNARRAGLPSQRRPWSTEEENALMAGLDRVKGPHWSQILAMFGPGGTVSEALKDRNQVQLKDKARNLKLFFLKSGIEVPYYLQFVTGELKTRAPGQAAKNAAKKAVEASAEEDAAHVAAVTALGNAHRSVDQTQAGQVAPQAPMMGGGGNDVVVDPGLVDPQLRDDAGGGVGAANPVEAA
ncbi:telomere repeat binding factor-domain-containing protein [Geopyxis carbonaria]|nr:telomere repeat binding factor-domain-containing protein [Geopyxis carbonaria]